jgi:3-dehydroquinate synthetase
MAHPACRSNRQKAGLVESFSAELRGRFRRGSARQPLPRTDVASLPAPAPRAGLVPEQAGRILRDGTLSCDSAKSYDVLLLEGILNPGSTLLADLVGGRQCLLVTTPTVASLYKSSLLEQIEDQGLDIAILVLDCTEQKKSLDLVSRICSFALERRLDRCGLLIGVGGGVCTDLVTVAASWIRRGIRHMRIPTTLVGQIDAGIGLKGAVNFGGKKSFLGCFYPPEKVLIDPLFLRTLPVSHLRCGLAEIIKIALVRDPKLFDLVEAHAPSFLVNGFTEPYAESRDVLWFAAKGMLEELATNAYEDQTYRRLVDFGHTFSPLLESASHFTLPHGEAVAIDMALSAVLACSLGHLEAMVCERILATIISVGLPVYAPELTPALCWEALREAARHRGGAPNLVVPIAAGSAIFLDRLSDLSLATLERAIQSLAATALGPRSMVS